MLWSPPVCLLPLRRPLYVCSPLDIMIFIYLFIFGSSKCGIILFKSQNAGSLEGRCQESYHLCTQRRCPHVRHGSQPREVRQLSHGCQVRWLLIYKRTVHFWILQLWRQCFCFSKQCVLHNKLSGPLGQSRPRQLRHCWGPDGESRRSIKRFLLLNVQTHWTHLPFCLGLSSEHSSCHHCHPEDCGRTLW